MIYQGSYFAPERFSSSQLMDTGTHNASNVIVTNIERHSICIRRRRRRRRRRRTKKERKKKKKKKKKRRRRFIHKHVFIGITIEFYNWIRFSRQLISLSSSVRLLQNAIPKVQKWSNLQHHSRFISRSPSLPPSEAECFSQQIALP